MLLLAIDTSATASAALVEGNTALADHGSTASQKILAQYDSPDTRSHAEKLLPAIADMCSLKKPATVLVGIGPGPFTGLRAGIAAAQMLSFAWGVPLFGVMSLHALAWDAVQQQSHSIPPEFLVASDARRREVYWAQYTAPKQTQIAETPQILGKPQLLDGPQVSTPDQLPEELPVYGYGAGLYRDVLGDRVVEEYAQQHPRAVSLAGYALATLSQGEELPPATPEYLRGADAKIPGPRKPVKA